MEPPLPLYDLSLSSLPLAVNYTYIALGSNPADIPRIVIPLFLAKSLIVSFFNPFRRAKAENASGQINIQVKWGRERFNIPIPQPSITPLSTLLHTLSSQTSLPLSSLKLIHKGAVLKDSSLTLSSYGITDGSILVLVGKDGDIPSAPTPSSSSSSKASTAGGGQTIKKKPKQPDTQTESVLVDWIRSLVSSLIDPYIPSIATFVSQSSPKATNRPAHIPPFEILQKEHAKLSEMLLKALLELDGVQIPSGWNDARQERKNGVKKIQGELNKVDEAWGERKRIGA
ncbi:hypothetical protein CI109_100450 [Kwoniella shandongensis]|uniref:Uncharacterized protein n=1 Tax=Kwoniella shandongensis TaxID=1734106 RepID=A0A5M6C3Q3_9TREE|nr:uncharacterized protein CI109_001707 [Kwoniella shandongensis]KAA5529768.1 hypothetical protein CI109_001707 [Kwoniella shandongensis]